MSAAFTPSRFDGQTSIMRLTRAVLPGMLDAGQGAIVNVSSEASLRASASGVAYAASKHAVNGLGRGLRRVGDCIGREPF